MKYVVAVRRECRDTAPSDLLVTIAANQDIELIGSIRFNRMIIDADEQAIDKIRADHGDMLHVEPVMTYGPARSP